MSPAWLKLNPRNLNFQTFLKPIPLRNQIRPRLLAQISKRNQATVASHSEKNSRSSNPKQKHSNVSNSIKNPFEEYSKFAPLKDTQGQVLNLSGSFFNVLKKNDSLPKKLKEEFSLFESPSLLWRKPTLELIQQIETEVETKKNQHNFMIDGKSGSGKTVTLLQIASHCYEAGWITIYIPEVISWMNGTYSYNRRANSEFYDQATLASKLAGQILGINKQVLDQIPLQQEIKFGKSTLTSNNSLAQILDIATKDVHTSISCLSHFFECLSSIQKTPVLLAVDQLNVMAGRTMYNSVKSEPLSGFQLSPSNMILDFFTGKRQLCNGAVVSAHSQSDFLFQGDLQKILNLNNSSHWQERMVPNYTKEESFSLLEFYQNANVVFTDPSHEFAVKMWMLSSGNGREFLKVCMGHY